jgi:hypothetical protein
MNTGTKSEVAIDILRMYSEAETEGWDLHSFFELLAGDNQARRLAVFDTVDVLVLGDYLESRGSDFYTITAKGLIAARRGRLDED